MTIETKITNGVAATSGVHVPREYIQRVMQAIGHSLDDPKLLEKTVDTVAGTTRIRVQEQIASMLQKAFVDEYRAQFTQIVELHVKSHITRILQRQLDSFLANLRIEFADEQIEHQDNVLLARLSAKVYALLNNNGIHTLSDLLLRSRGDLTDIPNFGPKALKEVEALLAEKGLALSPTNYKNFVV